MELTEAYRECERITWTQAQELRLRHQAAAAGQAARARRHLRVRPPDRRHRRRHACRPSRRSPRWRRPGARSWTSARDARRTIRCCSRWPTCGRTSPCPWRRSASSSTAAWPTCGAPATRRFEDLLYYCRCVAGSVGRLSLGHLRHRSGDAEPGRRAGRLARRRPAADQHPARHPRGLRQRPRLPARRRPGQVRLRPAALDSPSPTPASPAWSSSRPSGPGTGTPPAAAAADARPPQRGLHRRDGGHLPPPARPHRGRSPRRVLRGRVSLSAGEKAVVAVKALAGRLG